MSQAVDLVMVGSRLANLLLAMTSGIYVLYRYTRTKLRQSLYWGLAIVSIGVAYVFTVCFAIGLVDATNAAYSIEETFLSLTIALFYYGCAVALTKNRFYSTFLTLTIFVLQEATILYFLLILNEYFVALFILVVVFGIPVVVFVAVFFTLGYRSSRSTATLLLAASFWLELVVAPTLLIVNLTPLSWLFYIANTGNDVLRFAGFIMLASPRSKQLTSRLATGSPHPWIKVLSRF